MWWSKMVPITGIDNLANMFNSIIQWVHIVFAGTLVFLIYKLVKPDGAEVAPEKEKSGWLKNLGHKIATKGPFDTEAKRDFNQERREKSTALNEMINQKKVLDSIVQFEAAVTSVEVPIKVKKGVTLDEKAIKSHFKDVQKRFDDLKNALRDEGNSQRRHYKQLHALITELQGRPGAMKDPKLASTLSILENQVLVEYDKVQKSFVVLGTNLALLKRPENVVNQIKATKLKNDLLAIARDMNNTEQLANKESIRLIAEVTSEKNYNTSPK